MLWRLLFVRAELVEALACWFGGHAWVQGGGRGVRPAAQWLSFASPKESHQRKGDPARCVPSLRCGQPAVLVRGARRGTRFALRAPLGQPRRVRARSTRAPTRVPPHALRSSAHREGDPRIGHPHGPSLRLAPSHGRKRHALRRRGRAQQRPVWLFGCPPPAGCACGGAVVGWHGRRSAHAS